MSSNESDTRTKIMEATWRLMEENRAQGVRMSDIAKAAGISRQAVYLHFANRTDLIRATRDYIDEINGLEDRLQVVWSARNGVEMMNAYVDVWGNYLPEIHGVAGALLAASDTDEAAAAAMNDCMSAHREGCRQIIEVLHKEGRLAPEWPLPEVTELLWTMLSFQTWEQLTVDCGWSRERYNKWMKTLLARALIN